MKKLIFLCGIVCTTVYVQGMDHRLTEDDSGHRTALASARRPDTREAEARAARQERIRILGPLFENTKHECGWLSLNKLIYYAAILTAILGCVRPGRAEYRNKDAMLCWFAEMNYGWLQDRVAEDRVPMPGRSLPHGPPTPLDATVAENE
ncbi:MAG: hypothetical protein LBB25_00190 [Holosporaceae bacterium]|jgi:hypothetical protein|nr:hypothetical protein [Holosporaceae bacterium]